VNTLEEWAGAVRGALDLGEPAHGEQGVVLDLARDVAHAVARPAAPLSAYLLGLAVGRGADPATAAGTIAALARDWPATHP
jgi:Domain of unknown function (DUF6457)